jgi:hypothetical protein
MMKECRLRVFENRVLRRMFGPNRNNITRSGENYTMSLIICTHQIHASDQTEKNEIGRANSTYGSSFSGET